MAPLEIITLSNTNCYLIETKDGYLLIDCGSILDKEAFLNNLEKLGLKLEKIRYLFLTHHHNDHCGLLPFLRAANRELTVILSKKCSDYLKTGSHFQHPAERYANPLLGIMIQTHLMLTRNHLESFEPYAVRETDIIIEHDHDHVNMLGEIGLKAKIFLTPGHTEDSISLVLDKAAFVGDAARNILNFTGTPYQPILVYNALESYNSWQKLCHSQLDVIYPAHGKPFPAVKIRNLLAKTAQIKLF